MPDPNAPAPPNSTIPQPGFALPGEGAQSNAPIPGMGAPPASQPATPASVRPEKFKTDEDWRKSYDEMERKLTSVTRPAAEEPASGGLDESYLTNFAKELEENGGKLTDATRRSLHGRGIKDAVIDATVANFLGAKAYRDRAAEAEAALEFGSREEWAKAKEFLGKNEAMRKAYQPGLASEDPEVRSFTAAAIRGAMGETRAPRAELNGGRGAVGAGDGLITFKSFEEQARAQADPLYRAIHTEEGRKYRDRIDKSIEHTVLQSMGGRRG